MENDNTLLKNYWNQNQEKLLEVLESSSVTGLSQEETQNRQHIFGRNQISEEKKNSALSLFLKQFKNPVMLILNFATLISASLKDWTDSAIILVIILFSTILSFFQEYNAGKAAEKLRTQVSLKTTVIRDGQQQTIPSDEIVPGDIVLLSAGSLIPADGIVLESKDLFVNQAILTGETFPVEKISTPTPEKSSLADRTNVVFMGTNVRSGSARILIIAIGANTAFGQIADRLKLDPPETEFERGIRHLGTC